MCGIFGIVGKNNNIDISPNLERIKHRGPDDSGVYTDSNVSLGFRRLSIIDLSPRGHQPMTNEDETVWLIFNGEIYNFQELKKDLLSKHKFKSNTDTEVLIHGYEEWGIDGVLKRINGMFGLCIYDKKNNLSFLARDRIGKKPVYYYKNQHYVAFASEIKALFKLKEFTISFDQEMLDLWMGFPYLPNNEKTIIKNIYKVAPGHYLKIDSNLHTSAHSYWQLPKDKSNISFPEAQEKLEKLLTDSVTIRLMADVPLGILLSGGVDSSLITALASQNSSKKVKTITISFPNSIVDESKYAQKVAEHCGTEHVNLSLKVNNIYGEFRSNIAIYDDLSTTDSGLFSEYLLAKEIRKLGVIVILVGEGADEIFGGYSWFQLSQYPFKFIPNNVKSMMYYYAIMRSLPSGKSLYYANYLNKKLEEIDGSYFRKIQKYEIQYSLPNHYCMKVDKGTMAASIEARAPFMDYRMVELATQLPPEYLLRSAVYSPKQINEKYIIRSIAQKYLPETIAQRKKKGGMMPVYDLLNTGLAQDSHLILKNENLTEFYGKNYLKNLIESKPTQSVFKWQREWILWKCLVFALWSDHYINK